MYNSISLTHFAPTIAAAFGIEPPAEADTALQWANALISDYAKSPIDRVLIYNPDAVAMWLYNKYNAMFAPVLQHTQLALPFKTVMPSVTPVCFGTMYTGAMPAVHGICAYEKPIITIDTLFDSAIRAGKKVAIVAVKHSSMAHIYNNRALDYYFEKYDDDVEKKALELIERDEYDLISVYTQEYDDVMHAKGVENPKAMAALEHQIACFDSLAKKMKSCWQNHSVLYTFSPDHGVHQQEDIHGNHGTDSPLDLNIMHFIGVKPKND